MSGYLVRRALGAVAASVALAAFWRFAEKVL